MTIYKETKEILQSEFDWICFRGVRVEALILDKDNNEYKLIVNKVGLNQEDLEYVDWKIFICEHQDKKKVNDYITHYSKIDGIADYEQMVIAFIKEHQLQEKNIVLFNQFVDNVKKLKKATIIKQRYGGSDAGLETIIYNPSSKEFLSIHHYDDFSISKTSLNTIQYHYFDRDTSPAYTKKASLYGNKFNLLDKENEIHQIYCAFTDTYEEATKENTKSSRLSELLASLLSKAKGDKDYFEKNFFKDVETLSLKHQKMFPNRISQIEYEFQCNCKLTQDSVDFLLQLKKLPDVIKEFISKEENIFEKQKVL